MLTQDQIADIQGFHKVYQHLFKSVDAAIMKAGYSLTEKDVLLEISKTERCTANILIGQLGIDRSYMSRMLKQFEKKGLIQKSTSDTDSRIKYIRLTDFGREEFNRLSDIQNRQIAYAFEKISSEDVNAICASLVMTRNKLSEANDVITIRPFRQSDIEYVISRHKTLYYAERHLSGTFSAYVDYIVHEFADQFNPETDCLNILECNGVPAGSIAIKKAGEDTAQLRFFMLEPEMRRRGYGNRLMELALDFCKIKHYKTIFLLTITAQVIARHIYETHGFHKVSSVDKSEWGEGVIEEYWELNL